MIKTIVNGYEVRAFRRNDACVASIHLIQTFYLIKEIVLFHYSNDAWTDKFRLLAGKKHLELCERIKIEGPYKL